LRYGNCWRPKTRTFAPSSPNNHHEVKAENKTHRVEDQPPAPPSEGEQIDIEQAIAAKAEQPTDDADVPEFLKKDRKQKAA
jgi:hypothetical protein